jgi:hypothetical protein
VRDKYQTSQPILFALAVVMVFFATTLVFFVYDCAMQRQQDKLLATAKRTTAIVSSLFPKNVQERLLKEAKESVEEELKRGKRSRFAPSQKLKEFVGENFHDDEEGPSSTDDSPPLADLFPSATIMFADLSGKYDSSVALRRHSSPCR